MDQGQIPCAGEVAVTMPDFTGFASKNLGNVVMGILIFVALWFDPRIGYIQRDIADNRTLTLAMDAQGTRKDQQDIGKIQDTDSQFERRITAEEQRNKHVDDMLTAILSKLSK